MHFAISVIGVLIFAGLTAYDTQYKRIYFAGDSRDIASHYGGAAPVSGFHQYVLVPAAISRQS